MARVLVTGMSGAGKSTLLGELRRRGLNTVDTDYEGWTLPDGTWDEPRGRGATIELDARQPVVDLADAVERLV